MDKPEEVLLSETSHSQKDMLQILIMAKVIEIESRMAVAKGWGIERKMKLSVAMEFSFPR